MISREDLQSLADAYTLGEDIALTAEGQAMALAQADRVVREFRKVQKKIDVIFTDRDPYRDFGELRQDVKTNRRMYVYTGASETPLWSPQVNWMARAVHDWDHLVADVDFSVLGELAAFRHTTAKAPELEPLYLSEIALQAAASQVLGSFPSGPQKLVKVSSQISRKARQLRMNPARRQGKRVLQLVWDAEGLLRFMTPEELMIHLRAEGLEEQDAMHVVLAADLLHTARVE